MRLGRFPLILLSLLSVPSVRALASDHWGQHTLSQDFESGSVLVGLSGSYEMELGDPNSSCVDKLCGLGLAFAGGFAVGSEWRARFYLGPRILLFPRKPVSAWSVWVQPLGGVHYSSNPTERSDHPFAWKISLGADFGVKEVPSNPAETHRSFRGWMFQVERVVPPGRDSNAYYAAGFGYVWRKIRR